MVNVHDIGNDDTEAKENAYLLLCAVCNLLKIILSFEDFVDLPKVRLTIDLLAMLLQDTELPHKVKNEISLLGECFIGVTIVDEHMKVGLNVLEFLLSLTLADKNVKKVNIKRVWSLRLLIDQVDLSKPEWISVQTKLWNVVRNPHYLKCREGQHLIGFMIRRNSSVARKIHAFVVKQLPSISKTLAAGYGQAYFVAWSMAGGEVKQVKFVYQFSLPRFLKDETLLFVQ